MGGATGALSTESMGREKLLALGTFPEVSLAKARERRENALRLIADNADPGVVKQVEKNVGADTFRVIATEWLSKQCLATATLDKATWTFEQLLFPELGDRPIKAITAPDLLGVLRKIESRGAIETAHRAKQRASQVFRYAIATGRATHDPVGDLRGALTPKDVEHRAAITEANASGNCCVRFTAMLGSPRHIMR